jgi:hypothetical protein
MTTWLDEFRIVKGTAAWTSGFTPPTVAYATGDIPAFTGLVTDRTAVLATTEAADTAAFAGTVASPAVTGTLIVTEAGDTASFPSGKVEWRATLTTTEASDTAAFNGTVLSVVTGTLVTTEAADVASFNGTVATPGTVTGTLVVTEAPDTAAFNGAVTGVAGTLTATEAADTAAFNGQVLSAVTGTLTATEAADTAAFTGSLSLLGISATLTATEAPDTASFTGTRSSTVSAKLVTSFTPAANRNDLTCLVGMEFRLTVDTPFNGVGIRCGLNNTGLHSVELYDRTTHTLLRSANVDLTGKTEGTFYYADITPITLVAGTTYALMARVTGGDGQQWSEFGPTTLKDAQPGSVFATYEYPLGSGFTTTVNGNYQYVGVDLSYSVTVSDVAPIRGGGDAWVDYGREKRRKPRGLRQAEKFFEEQQQARDAEKRRLEEVAQRARAKAEQAAAEAMQAGEMVRAEAILAAARNQQQRQSHIDSMMMALANAKVNAAQDRLLQVRQLQAMERDEEDAITLLLLH